MKKTFATIIITGTMLGMSFAAGENDKSFFGQIKSLFVKEAPAQIKESHSEMMIKTSPVLLSATTSTASSSSEEGDDTASSTATTTEKFACLDEKKLSNKKSKTEKSIKEQTADKNKITKSLTKLEASLDTKSAAKIKEKRVQLEKEVKDVTDIEEKIINIASTTLPMACDDDEKKSVADAVLKIKKLDADVVDEADDVTVLIQKDIKEILKTIK